MLQLPIDRSPTRQEQEVRFVLNNDGDIQVATISRRELLKLHFRGRALLM